MRRPIVAVLTAESEPLCLVDQNGIMLPWVDTQLPKLHLRREGGSPTMTVEYGQPSDEPRVHVAAGITKEWQEELAPLVDQCPQLLEVDASNLDERWVMGPEYPEVRVLVRRADGLPVILAYGRRVDSHLRRVPVTRKAEVLRKILAKHEGLEEVIQGDLRFSRRWADYIQPREPGIPDPNGPWKQLLPPSGK